jgi:hypothetical protein
MWNLPSEIRAKLPILTSNTWLEMQAGVRLIDRFLRFSRVESFKNVIRGKHVEPSKM